jgi:hypothetical protein
MQKTKQKQDRKDHHEEEAEVEPKKVETPDISEILEDIDSRLEEDEELREALSGCAEDNLEAVLKLRYDDYLEEEAVVSTEEEEDRIWNKYWLDKDKIYQLFGTTREEYLSKKGCVCGCPMWI